MATLAEILNLRVDDLRQVCEENGIDPRGMNRAELQQVLTERFPNNVGGDAGDDVPLDPAVNPPAGDVPPPGVPPAVPPPPPADVPLAAALAPSADQIRLQELLLERERIQLERDRMAHERAMQGVGLVGAVAAPRDFKVMVLAHNYQFLMSQT